jgi:2-methylcitrate dehydratase PrpD
LALEEGGVAQAHLFGGGRVPARTAALVNGATSHALDYDDTHFAHIGHPSVAVFLAALAMAERVGADGVALQHAALLGIETSIRVGVWLGRDHYQHGFHQTGTAGAFGAAAAAARLFGFDATQVAETFGLVATRASGLKAQFGTMGKPFNAGIAASNGVEAALLVANGMVGNPEGLEAAQGFGPTHSGLADEAALEGLGDRWLMDSISHKFHACCHGLHASLEAVGESGLSSTLDVAKIEVTTHPRWMSVCNQQAPSDGLGANFSYRMVMAMTVLGHDTAALTSYSDALCADTDLVALRDRVSVFEDAALTEMQARVVITLDDGSASEVFHDLDTPIALADREDRLKAKAVSLVGAAKADALWSWIADPSQPTAFGALI